MSSTHRVAIELEVVDEDPEQAEPEDWNLQDLREALQKGHARLVRTIQGLVVDSEHDELSSTLAAIADDLAENAALHWLATATRWPELASRLRSRRPSLEILVELEQLAIAARTLAERLRQQGL